MTETRNAKSSWTRPVVVFSMVTMFGSLAAVPAQGFDRKRNSDDLRGYVDGSAFAELANDREGLVEVSLKGPLLKMVTGALGQESEELSELFGGIAAITAVVVEPEEGDEDRVRSVMREMRETLENDGWETLAHARQGDMNATVMALHDPKGEVIEGLTVMVMEHGDKVVFANIAGRIDLRLVVQVGKKLGVPGLSELAGLNLKELAGQHTTKGRKVRKERKERSERE